MATATQVKANKAEVAPRPRPLSRNRESPFFLSRLRDEFDTLFDRFAMGWPRFWSEAEGGWRWSLDVKDYDDAIVVRAEAPGFEPGDFDVQVQDGQLTLKATRKTETKEPEREEWMGRECYQSIVLPVGIDKNRVEANYRNGILTIKLPKTAEAKGQRVQVKGG